MSDAVTEAAPLRPMFQWMVEVLGVEDGDAERHELRPVRT